MSDIVKTIDGISQRLKDMGDGTFARVIAFSPLPTVAGSDIIKEVDGVQQRFRKMEDGSYARIVYVTK